MAIAVMVAGRDDMARPVVYRRADALAIGADAGGSARCAPVAIPPATRRRGPDNGFGLG
jgi:hypothetical protein